MWTQHKRWSFYWRKKPMALPEYVIDCPLCEGKGEYKQTYTAGCGGGYYQSMGPCEMCGTLIPDEARRR